MNGTYSGGPLLRIVLDGGAAVLLLLSFGYWWQGNFAHEVFGTALFLLLIRHLLSNSRWWSGMRRGRYDLRRRVNLGLTLLLATAMLVLLVTSLAISRSVFAFLPLPESFTLREIHWFAAYWVMVIVGAHLGLNWPRSKSLLHNVTGLRFEAPAWRCGLNVAGTAIVLQGLASAVTMDLWTRLSFGYSLMMWDFNAAASEFFLHWLAIVAFCAVLAHLTVHFSEFAVGHAAAIRDRWSARTPEVGQQVTLLRTGQERSLEPGASAAQQPNERPLR